MSNKLQIKSFEEYQEKYKLSIENPEKFWGEIAEEFSMDKEMGQSAGMEFPRA